MDVSGVNVFSNAVDGLKKATAALDQAAQNIAGGSLNPQDVVSLSQSAIGFKANAAVLRTEDEVTQSLLDITA
jgi:flagellar hook protein FlgE